MGGYGGNSGSGGVTVGVQQAVFDAYKADNPTIVPAPTGIDDTVNIQTALDKKGHVTISKPGTYLVQQLQIDSNTWLELGDGVTLKLKNGTSKDILVNKGWKNSYRSTNIKITGGTWDGNKANNPITGSYPSGFPGMGIVLVNIDGLVIEDVVQSGGFNKYAFYIVGCTYVRCNNINFNNTSDGLHFAAPGSNIHVSNISGYCGDNMLPFVIGDYPSGIISTDGSFYNVMVENIYPNNCAMDVIRLVGSGLLQTGVFENFDIRNVYGTLNADILGIIILESDQSVSNPYLVTTNVKNFKLSNVDIRTPVGTAGIQIGCTNGSNIVIDGVQVDPRSTTRPFAIYGVNYDKITIKNISCLDNIHNLVWDKLLAVSSSARINTLLLDNISMNLKPPGTISLFAIDNCSIKNLYIDHCDLQLNYAGDIFQATTGDYASNGTSIFISNSYINLIRRLGTFGMKAVIFFSNILGMEQDITITSGGNVRLYSSQEVTFGAVSNSGGSFSATGFGVRYKGLLASINAMNAGDMIFIDNASESRGGFGLYQHNGTNWYKVTTA